MTDHSPHHRKMLKQLIDQGFIKRVGDTHEITPAGHAYAKETSDSFPTFGTLRGNDEAAANPHNNFTHHLWDAE